MKVQAIGIDCWKDPIFHLVGLDRPGHIARKKRFSQTSWCLCGEPATCLVGMEACCVPRITLLAQFVRRFVKSNRK